MAKGQPFARLKSWCTVGTPFLDYRPNRLLFNRLGNTGLTFYATAIGALLFTVGLLAMYFFGATPLWKQVNETLGEYAFTGFYLLLMLLFAGYGTASLAILYSLTYMRGGWHSQKRKKKVASLYADQWLGLWHHDDEAISALSNVRSVKGAIIPSTFLVPIVTIAPLLVTVLGIFAIGFYFLTDQSTPSEPLNNFLQGLSPSSPTGWSIADLPAIGLPIAIVALIESAYIGIMGVIVALFKLLARAAGWPLAKLIDNLVWSSVRQQAWGDDRGAETVQQIGDNPPEFDARFSSLPAAIAKKLSEHSEKQAILTLKKVREILGMTRDRKTSPSSPELKAQLSEHLTWRELIHTTYFDIPEFVDLLAFSLQRAGLAEFQADCWPHNHRDQVQAWYSTIAPPSG